MMVLGEEKNPLGWHMYMGRCFQDVCNLLQQAITEDSIKVFKSDMSQPCARD